MGVSPAEDGLSRALQSYEGRWDTPDSETYDFAARTPDGGRKYRKTPEEAGKLLEKHYAEGSAVEE